MKFENTEVWGFEHALRGMRNPKESWSKSDSSFQVFNLDEGDVSPSYLIKNMHNVYIAEQHYNISGTLVSYKSIIIGENDMKLAQALIRAGAEHRKFLRQIFVSVDITAPLYWWKEFDTYKVGTVANSTSTMHKLTSKPITLDCFEIDDYYNSLSLIDDTNIGVRVDYFIEYLEQLRQKYLETKDKKYWKELIRWIPESWLQTRTVTMNYENLLGMCSKGQRRFHKLNEWSGIDNETCENFIGWARTLPYAQEFIFIDEKGVN